MWIANIVWHAGYCKVHVPNMGLELQAGCPRWQSDRWRKEPEKIRVGMVIFTLLIS